jgi:hypothetical protein
MPNNIPFFSDQRNTRGKTARTAAASIHRALALSEYRTLSFVFTMLVRYSLLWLPRKDDRVKAGCTTLM